MRLQRQNRLSVRSLLLVIVGAFVVALLWPGGLEWLSRLNQSYTEFPTNDGGKISNYFWFQSGFLDSSHRSEIYYTPPGWFARKEHLFDLEWSIEDTLLTAQRVEFYHHGDRKAFAIWSEYTGCLVAKRIMDDADFWRNAMTPPKRRQPRWVAPVLDFAYIKRGFQPANMSGDEAARAAAHIGPEQPAVGGPNVPWDPLGEWEVQRVDLENDRLYASVADFPAGRRGTIVYSSANYDDYWRFDLDATLAANPGAHRWPLPIGAAVAVTMIRIPQPFDALKFDKRENMEALLALPGAQIVCTDEAPLLQGRTTTLSCDGSVSGAPNHFAVTGLWGDRDPQVVAVAIQEPWGRRYWTLPQGTSIRVPVFYGSNPIETVFFRFVRT